jgi:hypothetical protein
MQQIAAIVKKNRWTQTEAARLLVRRQALEYQRKNRGGRYRPADFLLHFRIQRWRKDSRKSGQIPDLIGSPTRARTWDLRINSASIAMSEQAKYSITYVHLFGSILSHFLDANARGCLDTST